MHTYQSFRVHVRPDKKVGWENEAEEMTAVKSEIQMHATNKPTYIPQT